MLVETRKLTKTNEDSNLARVVHRMKSVELFTGAGGLAIGTHQAGFDHSLLIEWDASSCQTINENVRLSSIPGIHQWDVKQGDIRDVTTWNLGTIDLVAGGPPCQPFSVGGKHRGVMDSRNMIPEFVRAVRETAPRAFILENVRGLARTTFANYFDYIKLQLKWPTVLPRTDDKESWDTHYERLRQHDSSSSDYELSYRVHAELVNAADFGVPQIRERVFIVGFRSDLNVKWQLPAKSHSRTALLLDQSNDGTYWERHGIEKAELTFSIPRFQKVREGSRVAIGSGLKPWRTVRDALHHLPEPFESCDDRDDIYNHLRRQGAKSYKGHTGSPLDWPSKTLKAGDHGVPGGENMIAFPDGKVRYFTVREAARIQTFPDSWRFSGAWSEAMRQLGNAVPVDLARIISGSIFESLTESNGELDELRSRGNQRIQSS